MTSRARVHALVAAIACAAVIAAFAIRWACDDAWITFVYSRALVRGDGLTWFGDHVEGYTNFLWMLWVALGMRLGADPLAWAWAGSLAALAAAIALVFAIVRARSSRDDAALSAAALAATNFTFLAFGTSGLETMWQTVTVAALWWQVERVRRDLAEATAVTARRLVAASLTAALALMIRLDSAVPCAVLAVALAHALVRARAGAKLWLAAIAPAAVAVGAWLAWKLSYYGDVVPNTAHAKLAWSADDAANGARYLARFLCEYWLWLPLAGAVALAIARRISIALPAALVVAWFAYVVGVGGDFMEFRFFVPIIPAIMAIVAAVVTAPAAHRHVPSPRIRALAAIAALAAASFHHAATFESDATLDSVDAMATFYGKIANNEWARLGAPLRALAGTDTLLASQSAGAIPYFADLPTVDQVGLNDAWVARHGDAAPPDMRRPGHQRYAPLSYLRERRVSFVVAAAQLVPPGALPSLTRDWIAAWVTDSFATPIDVVAAPIDVVAVPLDGRSELLLWYLTPTPAIDARLAELKWPRRRFPPR